MMSIKSKILAFCIPLIIFLEIMMVIITKSFICFFSLSLSFMSFICFFCLSFYLVLIIVCIVDAIIKSYQMAPGKSWVLIGPANESGMIALPFRRYYEELFVKRVKVPSESLCPMCNKIISTRKSQFYILFNKGLDALEMVIHRECIDQYAKTAKVDFERELTYINLNEKIKKSEPYTNNMVHLINLGTERKLDLYLLDDYEPKFSQIFNYPLDFNPEIFTYEEFEKYIMDKQTRIDQLELLKRQDRRIFSHYKQEFKSLKGEIKALKKELIKVRFYKRHYHALFEPVDKPDSNVWNIIHVEVFGPCSVCGQQFSLTDEVLMLYIPQKQKIEAFLHLQCKKNDTKSRKIYKWNSYNKIFSEDVFYYCLTSEKVKGIKKFDDCLFLETDQNTRDLMFGNIAVPGKTVVMVEDNTCVCDMDCNCNCNCHCNCGY